MKHSHSHFARLRAGWQSRAVRTVVATGALALVISALPMLARLLTDIGLFTAPHARTQATGVLSPKGDDLYLVRALAQRRQQAGGESEAPYGEMDMGYEGQALMASYLDEMQAAGVLPQELTEAFRYAAESGTEAWISLEERMACGVGACLACVCKSKEKDEHTNVNNKRICKDGPVFRAEEVTL